MTIETLLDEIEDTLGHWTTRTAFEEEMRDSIFDSMLPALRAALQAVKVEALWKDNERFPSIPLLDTDALDRWITEFGRPMVGTAFRAPGATDEQVAYECAKVTLGLHLGIITSEPVDIIDRDIEPVRFDAPFPKPPGESA